MATLTVNYTIPFGSSIRIGYKVASSSDPYTYLNNYPSYNQSPYTFAVPLGAYQVELTSICASCSGGLYSDPEVFQAVAV